MANTYSSTPALPRPGERKGLVRLFSSIWFGIVLLTVIILYSSIGSAVPPSRQYFELTEFEYFNHWLFAALIGLFCVVLTTATVVRIRVNWPNAGVLTTHVGLLLLAGGSLLYFGRKIEGNVLLWNPRVEVLSVQRLHDTSRGTPVIGQVVAAPGRSWETNIPMLGGRYRIEVEDVRHEGMTTAAEVTLKVTVGDAEEPQTYTLKQDRPENFFARLNEHIILRLAPTNVTDRFYDHQTAALLVRRAGQSGYSALFPLEGLPKYHERFVEGIEEIRDTAGKKVHTNRLRPWPMIDAWEMPLAVGTAGASPSRSSARRGVAEAHDWPFTMEIDGYLPYAMLENQPVQGGVEMNPIARVEIGEPDHSHAEWLFAMRGHVSAEFRWLDEATDLPEEWTRALAGSHVLDVWVKDKNVRRQYDIRPGQTIGVEGTEYELQVQDVQADWPLATAGFEGARSPVARIWVKTPGQEFQRSVLQRFPALNQDRDAAGVKITESGLADENLELRYFDASVPHFLVAAGEHLSPVVVYTSPGGKRTVRVLERSPTSRGETWEPFDTEDGMRLTLRELILRPRLESRPVVIPEEHRRPQTVTDFSLVRLHLTSKSSDWSTRVWVPFEPFNDEFTGQMPRWVGVDVPDFGPVEFLYGRMPRPLPGRLALEEMHVDFYPGGNRPAGWTSFIRWEDPHTRVVTRGRAFLNNTARIGPWTLFQASESSDHESFTILGVGNRDGVMTMLLGCCLITLGMGYAFYVKPVLKRRARQRMPAPLPSSDEDGRDKPGGSYAARRPAGEMAGVGPMSVALAAVLSFSAPASAYPEMATDTAQDRRVGTAHHNIEPPVDSLSAIQDRLNLDSVRLLIVQHNARYQTLEGWARELITSIHKSERLMGLDPVVAAFELMLNREAFDSLPVIYVKDMAVRKHITSHPVDIAPDEARRIMRTGLVSYDYLRRPDVNAIIRDLSSNMILRRAMDRYSIAVMYYSQVLSMFRIVPDPTGGYDSAWYTVDALFGNLGMPASHPTVASVGGVPGIGPEQAAKILNDFRDFGRAWLRRDVDAINRGFASFVETFPALAPAGTYPDEARRAAEVYYHRMNAFTFGWAFYIVALFVSIWALIAGWNWTRRAALLVFLAAFAFHGAGLGLRWYIIGRVPVANMFEAVVSSAWMGALVALILELATRRGVFVLAGSFLGFLSLALGKFVGGQISQIAPILDDIMLRIHTVLIIASYAIITLAFGVAVCYLAVSARGPRPNVARATLGVVGALGVCVLMAMNKMFYPLTSQWWGFIVLIPVVFSTAGALVLVVVPQLFVRPALAAAGSSAPPGAAGIVSAPLVASASKAVDSSNRRESLLGAFDLSHMILIHMATIALFVGLVLGAIWADYSWGRPWGWDPKEVFALVTWMFYAILIHVRFVARRKALWTAVMSCVGFAAMQFNWWVVNFFIVGLHSYA